jgi:hypothetical protein
MPYVHDHPFDCTYLRTMLSYTPNNTHPQSSPVVIPRKILFRYLFRGLRNGGLLSLKPTSMSTSVELVLLR